MNNFQKKISELKTAISSFNSAYPQNTHKIFSYVKSLLSFLKEISDLWNSYENSSDIDLSKKLHIKIKAKFEMMKRNIREAENSISSDSGKKKYGENFNYLKIKTEELKSSFPSVPECNVIQATLDFDFVEDKEEIKEEIDSEEEIIKDDDEQKNELKPETKSFEINAEFIRKLYELKDAVNGFVSRYKENKSNSVVGYITDILLYSKCIEDSWGRYWRSSDEASIKSSYDNIGKMIENIFGYCEMSSIIAKYNSVIEEYSDNLNYIINKTGELKNAFPDTMHGSSESQPFFGMKDFVLEEKEEEPVQNKILRRKKK